MKSIKKDWLPNLIRDWSPMSTQTMEVNGIESSAKPKTSVSNIYKLIWYVIALHWNCVLKGQILVVLKTQLNFGIIVRLNRILESRLKRGVLRFCLILNGITCFAAFKFNGKPTHLLLIMNVTHYVGTTPCLRRLRRIDVDTTFSTLCVYRDHTTSKYRVFITSIFIRIN